MTLNKKASIQTQRLTLHAISEKDTEQLVQLLTNHEITKTFMVPDFKTPEQVTALAETLISFSQIEDVEHLAYGIYTDDRLIGFINDCGMKQLSNTDEIEYRGIVHKCFYYEAGY